MANHPRWDGFGYLEVDGRTFRSQNLSPPLDDAQTLGIVHKGRRPLGPRSIQFFELESIATATAGLYQTQRYTIVAQMRRGGRGHLVAWPAPSIPGVAPAAALYPTRLGRAPGMLADLSLDAFDKSAGLSVPFYSPGRWIDAAGDVPEASLLTGLIVPYEPATPRFDHFHCGGNVLRKVLPTTGRGAPSSWRQLAWRMVWGPDSPIDLTGFAHYMAVAGIIPDGSSAPNHPRYVLLEFSSYPYRRDREDSHSDVDGKGGTSDVAWSWATSLDLPSPRIYIPGWPEPRGELSLLTDTGTLNPLDPPEGQWAESWCTGSRQKAVFPFARGLQQEVSANLGYGSARPDLIDFSRITAMQIRAVYSNTATEGGLENAAWSLVPPFLTWNTWDGAFVDPGFATNSFHMPIVTNYAPRLAIANLEDLEDEVSFFIAPTGIPS